MIQTSFNVFLAIKTLNQLNKEIFSISFQSVEVLLCLDVNETDVEMLSFQNDSNVRVYNCIQTESNTSSLN